MPINKGIQLEFLKACAHGNYDKVNSIIDSHLENGNIDINEPGELFEVSGDEGHKGKYLSAIQFACLSDAKSNTIIQLLIVVLIYYFYQSLGTSFNWTAPVEGEYTA